MFLCWLFLLAVPLSCTQQANAQEVCLNLENLLQRIRGGSKAQNDAATKELSGVESFSLGDDEQRKKDLFDYLISTFCRNIDSADNVQQYKRNPKWIAGNKNQWSGSNINPINKLFSKWVKDKQHQNLNNPLYKLNNNPNHINNILRIILQAIIHNNQKQTSSQNNNLNIANIVRNIMSILYKNKHIDYTPQNDNILRHIVLRCVIKTINNVQEYNKNKNSLLSILRPQNDNIKDVLSYLLSAKNVQERNVLNDMVKSCRLWFVYKNYRTGNILQSAGNTNVVEFLIKNSFINVLDVLVNNNNLNSGNINNAFENMCNDIDSNVQGFDGISNNSLLDALRKLQSYLDEGKNRNVDTRRFSVKKDKKPENCCANVCPDSNRPEKCCTNICPDASRLNVLVQKKEEVIVFNHDSPVRCVPNNCQIDIKEPERTSNEKKIVHKKKETEKNHREATQSREDKENKLAATLDKLYNLLKDNKDKIERVKPNDEQNFQFKKDKLTLRKEKEVPEVEESENCQPQETDEQSVKNKKDDTNLVEGEKEGNREEGKDETGASQDEENEKPQDEKAKSKTVSKKEKQGEEDEKEKENDTTPEETEDNKKTNPSKGGEKTEKKEQVDEEKAAKVEPEPEDVHTKRKNVITPKKNNNEPETANPGTGKKNNKYYNDKVPGYKLQWVRVEGKESAPNQR